MNLRNYTVEEANGDLVVSLTISPGPIDIKVRLPAIMKKRITDAMDELQDGIEELRGELE